MQLYDFQEPETKRMLDVLRTRRTGILAWEMGLGKTVAACWIARELGTKVLVICPKTLKTGWERTLAAFGITHYQLFGYEMALRKQDELVAWAGGNALVICDECHRGASFKSKTGKMMMRFEANYTLLLSATACQSPLDMKAAGYLLRLHRGKDFWQWAIAHGCRPGKWGGMEFDGKEKHLVKIHNYLFPHKGSRLSLRDVPRFKESIVMEEPIDFGDSDDIQKLYSDVGLELNALESRVAEYVDTPLTNQAALRQRVEILKVPETAELIEDGAADGMSVMVFTNYRNTIEALKKRVPDMGIIWGEQNEAERQAMIDEFQSGKIRKLAVQAGAGAEGLSLGDETGQHPRLALIFPSFNARQVKQCMGRPARITNATPATIRFLIAAKTIEERIQKVFLQKTQNMKLFNEGEGHGTTGQCKGSQGIRTALGQGAGDAGRQAQMDPSVGHIHSSGGAKASGGNPATGGSSPNQRKNPVVEYGAIL